MIKPCQTGSTGAGKKVSPSLSIVYRDIQELETDPQNPRRHSKKQIQQIARSIEAFGLNVPFLIDGQQRLIAGHGRLAACQLLGIRRVPTISLEHLSEPQIRAFMIADNRLTESAKWNDRRLAEQFKVLSELNLDFSLEATGFDISEINAIVEGLTPVPAGEEDLADALPITDPKATVTRGGDLWLLGSHRLLCGEASEGQSYSLLMNGRRAAAVFTHLPHGSNEDAESLVEVFSQLREHSDPAALLFVITEPLFIKSLVAAADCAGFELADLCVAVKQAIRPGRLYKNQRDLIFVFAKAKAEHSSKPQFERTNVWRYPRTVGRRQRSEQMKADVGPDELPLALLADAITESTGLGGIVLDPFLGKGATLMATGQTGRICYAIESDPLRVDHAVRRWQQVTGMSAAHVEHGMSFDQIAEVRNGKG